MESMNIKDILPGKIIPFPYQNPDKKVDKPINKEAFDTEGEHMQSTGILGERPLHGFLWF
jgi:hypothetical protein